MTYQQQKQQIDRLFQNVQDLAKKSQLDISNSLTDVKDSLDAQELYIVICGAFSCGKSTLLNAYLEEIGLLPMAIEETTNIITTVKCAPTERIRVVLEVNGEEEFREILRGEISQYVTAKNNPKNRQNVQALMIEIPNSRLTKGLVMVDTPGILSTNRANTSATNKFLPKADVVIFVSDLHAPLDDSEVNFIEENLSQKKENVIFVVTKADAVERLDVQAIVNANLSKIAHVFEAPVEAVTVIPVSSNLKMKSIELAAGGDDEGASKRLSKSNFLMLEEKLWEKIERNRGLKLIAEGVQSLNGLIRQATLPLMNELSDYQQKSTNNIAKRKADLEEISERLKSLEEKQDEWLENFSSGLEKIHDDVSEELDTGFNNIHKRTIARINSITFDVQSANQKTVGIGEFVDAEIAKLLFNLIDEIQADVTELHKQIQEESGLNPIQAKIQGLSYLPSTASIRISASSSVFSPETVRGAIEQSSQEAEDAAWIGRLFGGIVGAGLGLMYGNPIDGGNIGTIIGSQIFRIGAIANNTVQRLEQQKEREQSAIKMAVTEEFVNLIKISKAEMQPIVDKSISKLVSQFGKALARQIKRERKNCEKRIEDLTQVEQMNDLALESRIRELTIALEPWQELQNQVAQLQAN
jgi:small GTP-binding protein